MAQRNSQDELAFGSDSFLDVVANIVGILIILIVVAGLRVSRIPVTTESTDLKEPAPLIVVDELVHPLEPIAAPMPPPAPDPEPEPPTGPVLTPVPLTRPDPTPPPELVAQAARLESRIASFRSQMDQARNRQSELRDQVSRTGPQLAGLEQSVRNARDTESELNEQTRVLTTQVSSRERELSDLKADLLTRQASGPSTEVLSHRVTPIGRAVTGPELHFRLENNRVSVVPVDALAEELKSRIERNRDSLLRMQRYDGTVGPIEGYEMRFQMRQQHSSVLEELRFGRGFVKMGVVFWELLPQSNAPTESADEARNRNSRFYRTLQQAGPSATVTFWVYPDSFELHRELQEFAHSAGFEVAARPLPVGVPIAGSPNGSRSLAQ